MDIQLWTDIPPSPNTSILTQHQTAGNRITFLHTAAGYLIASIWLASGYQVGFLHHMAWPPARAVRQHLPKYTISVLGHLDQQRANRQSTKTALPAHQRTAYASCDLMPGQFQEYFCKILELLDFKSCLNSMSLP
jgi:hypothetical protein